jgi:hypothetical protein
VPSKKRLLLLWDDAPSIVASYSQGIGVHTDAVASGTQVWAVNYAQGITASQSRGVVQTIPVTYPSASTWEVVVPEGALYEVSDGSDTINVNVPYAIPQVALGVGGGQVYVAADARWLAPGLMLGRGFLAGPSSLIDEAKDLRAQGVRVGQTQAGTFSANWAHATALAEALGFSSLAVLVSHWTAIETLVQGLGFTSLESYRVPDNSAGPPFIVGLDLQSDSGFGAGWARTQAIAETLGFSSVSQFLANWNQVQQLRTALNVTSSAVWEDTFPGLLQLAAGIGVQGAASFMATWLASRDYPAGLRSLFDAAYWDETSAGAWFRAGLGFETHIFSGSDLIGNIAGDLAMTLTVVPVGMAITLSSPRADVTARDISAAVTQALPRATITQVE